MRRRSAKASTPKPSTILWWRARGSRGPLTTFNIAISVVLLSVASVMEIDRP
jgi:hypothetical protein